MTTSQQQSDDAILFALVQRRGLRATVELLAKLCFDHARIEDDFMRYEENQSKFHRAGWHLASVRLSLPSEPLPNDTIYGTPAKIYE